MDETTVINLARQFFQTALTVVGPLLGVAVVTGVLVSVAQVLTSIQDATLSYVIRLGAVGAVIVLLGRWMLHMMMQYTTDLWQSIPNLVGGS